MNLFLIRILRTFPFFFVFLPPFVYLPSIMCYFLLREKAWYILSRDACRDLRRMTFTSGGSHFIK